jgi:hypothetical protein
MSTISVVLNCTALPLNSISLIISLSVFVSIVYRLYQNFRRRRLPATATQSISVDSISLLLIGDTYIVIIGYLLSWFLLGIRTLIGDFSLVNTAYTEDPLACQIGACLLTFLAGKLYCNFCTQALSRFARIVLGNREQILPCGISLNRISGNIILIILNWSYAILVCIPAYTKLYSIVYLPLEFYCMPSLSSFGVCLYFGILSYVIPMSGLIYIYMRIARFIHHLSNHSRTSQLKRDVRAIKRIIMICCIMTVLAIPTFTFVFVGYITGKLYPLTYRIQSFTVAVTMFILSICLPVVNSLLTGICPQVITRVKPQVISHPVAVVRFVNNNNP